MLSPVQQLIASAVLIPFWGLNYFIGKELLGALDYGGSIFIWTYGAIFGLTMAWSFLFGTEEERKKDSEDNSSSYTSNTFGLFGTVFLFVLWPGFNAALAPGQTQYRVIINTILSLVVSTTVGFITSRALRGGKFNVMDIQRATLSGGIALASVSSILLRPGEAMAVGGAAGFACTCSFIYVGPWLNRSVKLVDTVGVNSIYLIPGLIGAITGIITSAIATQRSDIFGDTVATLFPDAGDHQAGWNTLALVITFGLAAVPGLLLGFILRVFGYQKYFYTDELEYDVPADFDSHPEANDHLVDEKKSRE